MERKGERKRKRQANTLTEGKRDMVKDRHRLGEKERGKGRKTDKDIQRNGEKDRQRH